MIRRLAFPGVLAMLLIPAPGASAQQDGVFVDPGSPAGKEYALPVARAREDATGGPRSARPPSSSSDAPLFGQGISRRGQRPSDDQRSGERPGPDAIALQRRAAAVAAGGSGTGWLLGLAAALVVVGGLTGLGLRRFRRGEDPGA